MFEWTLNGKKDREAHQTQKTKLRAGGYTTNKRAQAKARKAKRKRMRRRGGR